MRSSIGSGPNKSIIRRRQVLSSILFGWLGSGGYQMSDEYQAVIDYATAQGWTLPPAEEQVVADTYIRGLVASGEWAETDVLWIPATNGDRNFARINYKNPGTFTLTEVSSPTFTAGFGFSSSGTGYLNTGFKLVTNGVNYTTADCHFAIGVVPPSTWEIVANNNYTEFGVSGAALVNGVRFAAGVANGGTNTQLNSNSTKQKIYQSDFGYAVIERRSGASSYNRNRNYVVDSIAETFAAPNNGDVYMCAMNQNGTAALHSPRHVGMLRLGGGLTNAMAVAGGELWRNYIEYVRGINRVTVNATYSYYESTLEIVATRANYQFATDGYNIRYSSDYGATWTIRAFGLMIDNGQMDYRYDVTAGHIFADGTLLFTVASKIYRSTDGLATAPTEISPKNADGSPYTLHTPVDPIRPGVNFGMLDIEPVPSFLTDGREILVISCYTNRAMGAAPVSIWYTVDKGVNFKLAYQFGQNTNYRDDGSDDGGTTGTLLGNPLETNICRHMHSGLRNPGTLDWYFLVGDDGPTGEIAWYKMTYDENADTWSAPITLVKPAVNSEWKSVGARFSGSDVYFATDGGVNLGIYRGPTASIGTLGAFTKLFAMSAVSYGFKINLDTGFMVIIQASNVIKIVTGFGSASVDHTVLGANATGVSPSTIQSLGNADGRGYYKVNVGGNAWSIKPIKTVFIKEN